MRPITLVLQVAVAATSAAFGRAFTPRHLSRLPHTVCWRRLGSGSGGTSGCALGCGCAATAREQRRRRAAGAGAPQRQKQRQQQKQGHGLRLSLLGECGGRRQALALAARNWLHCLPRDHDKRERCQDPGVYSSSRRGRRTTLNVAALGGTADGSGSGSGRGDVDDILIQENNDRSRRLEEAEAAADAELNDSQREAVFADVGAVRVVAGPGSGKTRVLTRRIAHLVSEAIKCAADCLFSLCESLHLHGLLVAGCSLYWFLAERLDGRCAAFFFFEWLQFCCCWCCCYC